MSILSPADEYDFRATPTEWLVLEVLAARWRLGERTWTFPNEVRPTLRSLEAKGLIWWKSGIVAHTSLAGLTEMGEATWLRPGDPPGEEDAS